VATLLEIAEELYGLEPGEFTAARNERVRELKGTELGPLVKALRKPALAAWVVDLLVREEAEQVEQIVELGAAFREAQQGMDGAQLRELTRQRRELTAAVTRRARELADERGIRVTDVVAEEVESTLTAAMIDAEAARAVRSGLLVGPLTATGLGPVDVAAAVAAPDALGFEPLSDGAPRRHLRAVPDLPAGGRKGGKGAQGAAASKADKERAAAERELEAARSELSDAEDDVAAAQQQRDSADAELGKLEETSRSVLEEREELRERLAELDSAASRLAADLRTATKLQQRAVRTLTDAERRREEAARGLRELDRG
jgi:hypothetical protein